MPYELTVARLALCGGFSQLTGYDSDVPDLSCAGPRGFLVLADDLGRLHAVTNDTAATTATATTVCNAFCGLHVSESPLATATATPNATASACEFKAIPPRFHPVNASAVAVYLVNATAGLATDVPPSSPPSLPSPSPAAGAGLWVECSPTQPPKTVARVLYTTADFRPTVAVYTDAPMRRTDHLYSYTNSRPPGSAPTWRLARGAADWPNASFSDHRVFVYTVADGFMWYDARLVDVRVSPRWCEDLCHFGPNRFDSSEQCARWFMYPSSNIGSSAMVCVTWTSVPEGNDDDDYYDDNDDDLLNQLPPKLPYPFSGTTRWNADPCAYGGCFTDLGTSEATVGCAAAAITAAPS